MAAWNASLDDLEPLPRYEVRHDGALLFWIFDRVLGGFVRDARWQPIAFNSPKDAERHIGTLPND